MMRFLSPLLQTALPAMKPDMPKVWLTDMYTTGMDEVCVHVAGVVNKLCRAW